MNEIAKKRAELADDGKLWSPKDALEDAINRVNGKDVIGLAIWWWERLPDGGRTLRFSQAGLDRAEHLALLRMADHHVVRDWINE